MKLSNAHTETPTYGILHSAIVAKGVVTVVLTGVGLGGFHFFLCLYSLCVCLFTEP